MYYKTSIQIQRPKKQDQGASVQKTVWTVKRCINGGILSPALVVVCCSGLYCAVLVCTGLYLSVVGCTWLFRNVLDCIWLYLAVLCCNGLSWALVDCTGL